MCCHIYFLSLLIYLLNFIFTFFYFPLLINVIFFPSCYSWLTNGNISNYGRFLNWWVTLPRFYIKIPEYPANYCWCHCQKTRRIGVLYGTRYDNISSRLCHSVTVHASVIQADITCLCDTDISTHRIVVAHTAMHAVLYQNCGFIIRLIHIKRSKSVKFVNWLIG